MVNNISGTLPIDHTVDANGSLCLSIPIRIPPANLTPNLILSYHSAAQDEDVVGQGWAFKSGAIIERISATLAQDNLRGVVNYNNDDRFALNGQRLMHVQKNEYRFEIERWSKVLAIGSDPLNPDSWEEHRPDGTIRFFGNTSDSNIKAHGQTQSKFTRVWAVSESCDAFSNHATYTYNNDITNGSFYPNSILYGGNRALGIAHQRTVTFAYEDRPDTRTQYTGGYMICIDKRLQSISASFDDRLVYKYSLTYDVAPLTKKSRLCSIALSDANGATVNPLSFDWSCGNPDVFDPMKEIAHVDAGSSSAQVLPIDFAASGRTDLLVASNRDEHFHVDVYMADGEGGISSSPAPSLHSFELPPPTQLLTVDVNGDGRTNLLHIQKRDDGEVYRLTVLLSTVDGYEKQKSYDFEPDSGDGQFLTGDFQGNGKIGLIYVFTVDDSHVKLVQFAPDEYTFTIVAHIDGPDMSTFDNLQFVVGDLNGNGEEDLFVISPEDDTKYRIELFESQKGTLCYRKDRPLKGCGDTVPYSSQTAFTAYSADDDGKTGLLAISQDYYSRLQYQILRSTGPSLLSPPSPTVTDIIYDGNITLARTASTNVVDIVNVLEGNDGITTTSVLHFHDNTFKPILTKMKSTIGDQYSIMPVDLRGLGRADILFSHCSDDGIFRLHALACAGSKPVDFLVGYTNGLGAQVSVSYASLTDSQVYSTSASGHGSVTAAVNALSHNVTSSASLNPPSSFGSTGRGRSALVHFPKFVVKQVTNSPSPSSPSNAVYQVDFAYKNARIAYDGRNWLGFENVIKTDHAIGTTETSTYSQEFPFLGQTTHIQTVDTAAKQVIQSTTYDWEGVPSVSGVNQYITLPSHQEHHFEGGVSTYDVSITQQYDSFANVTQLVISAPKVATKNLTINSTFSNDPPNWILGNKSLEVIDLGDGTLKKTKFEYLSQTQVIIQTSAWIADDRWITRHFELDKAGKRTKVTGPGPSLHTFKYDAATNTFPIVASTFTDKDADPLVKETTYDAGIGLPVSVVDGNRHITSHALDVLGRVLEISEGDDPSSMVVLGKTSYEDESTGAKCVRQSRCDWKTDSWARTVTHIDGSSRTWRTEAPNPDNPSSMSYKDTEYDSAGRISKSSRNYLAGLKPAFITYSYDVHSRPTTVTSPPAVAGDPYITTTYQYQFSDGKTQITETRAGGGRTSSEVISREVQYLPNPKPSSNQYIQPYVTQSVNGLGQRISMSFDGLGRCIAVTDPAGVQFSVRWDGISRQTERLISNPKGVEPAYISRFSMQYDDTLCRTTTVNELSGSETIVKHDYLRRPISKISADETLTYTYDTGGLNSKDHLVSVSSSKGIHHHFDYDSRGSISALSLSLDDQTFTTSFERTPTKKILRKTNPNGTTATRSFVDNTNFVDKIELRGADGSHGASTAFSDRDNAFFRPLVCEYGNGLTLTSSIAENGAPTSLAAARGNEVVHQQTWELDGFSRIENYAVSSAGQVGADSFNRAFVYDISGRLTQSQTTSVVTSPSPTTFLYDDSGNIAYKDEKIFKTAGWQLSSVLSEDGTPFRSFTYSSDGNMTAKLDGSGTPVNDIKYDAEGRVVELDGVSFVYDFCGHLVKSVLPNGDVTMYLNRTYEVLTTAVGDVYQTAYITEGVRRASLTTHIPSGQSPPTSYSRYFHSDHLGSVIAVSDNEGQILTTYQYDSFGNVTIQGDDTSRYKYSGKELFSGLYYFGARFYDPEIGRFLTLDNYPLSLSKISPSTFNQYTFSQNDPINFIDFNGNFPLWHWIADLSLIALGIAAEFIPVPIVAQIASDMLIGAGINGLQYDATCMITNSPDSNTIWGINLAVGAAFGAIDVGVDMALDAVLPKVTEDTMEAVEYAGEEGTSALVGAGSRTALKQAGRLGVKAADGAAQGVVLQAATNLASGQSLGHGLLEGGLIGAAGGLGKELSYTGYRTGRAYRGYTRDKYVLNPKPKGPPILGKVKPSSLIKDVYSVAYYSAIGIGAALHERFTEPEGPDSDQPEDASPFLSTYFTPQTLS